MGLPTRNCNDPVAADGKFRRSLSESRRIGCKLRYVILVPPSLSLLADRAEFGAVTASGSPEILIVARRSPVRQTWR